MQKLTRVKGIRTALVWVMLALILVSLLVAPTAAVADGPQPAAADIGLAPDDNHIPSVHPPVSWLPAVDSPFSIEWTLAQVSGQVELIRGLQFSHDVPISTISRQQWASEQMSSLFGSSGDFTEVTFAALHLISLNDVGGGYAS